MEQKIKLPEGYSTPLILIIGWFMLSFASLLLFLGLDSQNKIVLVISLLILVLSLIALTIGLIKKKQLIKRLSAG